MPIPDFQSIMLPLLRWSAGGDEHTIREAVSKLSVEFNLTPEELAIKGASGQGKFYNRVAWAKIHIERAGLLDKTRRGYFKISSLGSELLKSPPDCLTVRYLSRYEGFKEFRGSNTKTSEVDQADVDIQTPHDALLDAYEALRDQLTRDLLAEIMSCSASFFEQLVVDLLRAMGYGGLSGDAVTTPRGADEGIDGILKQDPLGLDIVYLQAKRWKNPVGRPEVQQFVGALHGKRSRKGVFLTTSTFTQEAVAYVASIEPKVILIDGAQVASMMIDYRIGVTPRATYVINRIDTDYFLDE